MGEVFALRDRLLAATVAGSPEVAVQQALPLADTVAQLAKATKLLRAEPTLLEIQPPAGSRVIIVGDTHGQFHDVVHMLDKFGYPGEDRVYIFNGDYVDRGSWGWELLALLTRLKVAYPSHCYLLRGNHESTTCTTWYGFKAELAAKWGPDAKKVYAACKVLFSVLPLAALIHNTTLVLHGGLFRQVPPSGAKAGGRRKRRRVGGDGVAVVDDAGPQLGGLDTLRAASKGGVDPDGQGNSVVAADVLWSDPVGEPTHGLKENDARGIGLVFGPDVTQEFLEANQLALVIRSHEGPDARAKREDLPQVLTGWSLDHDTPAGRLITLFSAPDYPQFIPAAEDRYHNQGAVAVLAAPDWGSPELLSFDAVLPRPQAIAYYDYEVYAETDEEPQGSEGATSADPDVVGDDTALSAQQQALTAPASEEQPQQQQQPSSAPPSPPGEAVPTPPALPPAQPAAAAGPSPSEFPARHPSPALRSHDSQDVTSACGQETACGEEAPLTPGLHVQGDPEIGGVPSVEPATQQALSPGPEPAQTPLRSEAPDTVLVQGLACQGQAAELDGSPAELEPAAARVPDDPMVACR